jgi:hypothetical protein
MQPMLGGDRAALSTRQAEDLARTWCKQLTRVRSGKPMDDAADIARGMAELLRLGHPYEHIQARLEDSRRDRAEWFSDFRKRLGSKPGASKPTRRQELLKRKKVLEADIAGLDVPIHKEKDGGEWRRKEQERKRAQLGPIVAELADVDGAFANNGDKPLPEPDLLCAADVKLKKVEWLFESWLPRGALTILDGDPNRGKSLLALDLAARVTTGRSMTTDAPSGKPCCDVLIMSIEDDIETTQAPRLKAAGADMKRIHFVRGMPEAEGLGRPANLADLAILAASPRLKGRELALVIVDPFYGFLPREYNPNHNQDVYRFHQVFQPLISKLRIGILGQRHLSKNSDRAAEYRGMGAIAISGVSRMNLIVGRDPAKEKCLILARLKWNLGPPRAGALAYEIIGKGGIARIEWKGESTLRPADILWHHQPETSAPPGRPADKRQQAKDWLRARVGQAGADGVDSKLLEVEAKALGFKKKTLRRAKDSLKMTVRPIGKNRRAWVMLISTDGQNP